MLLLLPIIVALAGVPTPAPSSADHPTPLTEIGRVRALPACVPIVAHANGAITEALENDRALAIIATNLRNTDYDRLNALQRRNAVDALLKRAETVTKAAAIGDAEVKRLREYAVNSPDPKRKEELKTFADALGGAMYRQKKAASEFQRDVAIMRGRDEIDESKERTSDISLSSPHANQAANVTTAMSARPTPTPDPQYDKYVKILAGKLDDLNQAIMHDEGVAADHSIAATAGC